ncbi:MAG: hypothetical protein JOY91_01000 [Sinobacteraceae bacterium]|nr:hypothetical protein [Nevskiaceae bacterium]
MQDLPSSQTRASAQRSESGTLPSTSRMITNYLADIEHLLDSQRWDLARRDALELPGIAVALADAQLAASAARARDWCEHWLPRPEGSDDCAERESILAAVAAQAQTTPGAPETSGSSPNPDAGLVDRVPSRALRALRLRRHARARPRGAKLRFGSGSGHQAAETIRICAALIEAVRRWYGQSAVHDDIVQRNLARLAVLR